MELKDFVEDTLLQIISGVKSAQTKEAGCLPATKGERLCTVHFDVSLGSDNLVNADGSAGAFFGTFMAKGRASTEDKQTSQNKVQFDIPIHLPVNERKAQCQS